MSGQLSSRMNNAQFSQYFVPLLSLGIVVFFQAGSAAETIVVTDIEGHKTNGTLISWSADKLIVDTGSLQEISRTTIRSVTFEHPTNGVSGGQSLIWFSNGDRLSAHPIKVTDDLLTVSWPLLGSVDPKPIPLEKLSAIIFELPATMFDQYRLFADLETLPPGSDLVMLINGDRSTGEFQRLDASFVELKANKNLLKLDRSRTRAIRLNPELTNATRTKSLRFLLSLTDGSRLTATSLESNGDMLEVNSLGLGKVILSLKNVVSCSLFGGRVIPISDYEPSKVEFTPFLSSTWPLVRNANVWHGPLVLRGTEFATGLGTHSRMAVTYDLRGHEQAFQSVVGIDDVANGAGSVVFAVDVDGKRVWTSPELTGKSAVISVPELTLQGKKKLTLLVDFGQYADVSDYADWCDAVLIVDSAHSKEEN